MSTAINTVTIGAVVDKRLLLRNSQAGRVISIGTNWTKLRIGIRCVVDDAGVSLGGTPRLYLGVMSSPSGSMANGPLTASTSHFVGSVTNGTWSRSGVFPSYSSIYANTSVWFVKKINSTITNGTGGAGTFGQMSGNPSTGRAVTVVEIEKGSPNWTATLCYQGGTMNDFPSASAFAGAMEVDTIANVPFYLNNYVAGVSWSNSSASTLAVDEATNGYCNAVVVAWGRTFPALYVSDLIWSKIA